MFFQLIFEIQNLFQIGLQLWCFNNGKGKLKSYFSLLLITLEVQHMSENY